MTEDDAIAMAAAGTVAVLLPGAFYFLRETPIAISTDLNPGTSPGRATLRLMLNMA